MKKIKIIYDNHKYEVEDGISYKVFLEGLFKY